MFTLVKEVNLVFGFLDLVADCLIERSCHGHVPELLGVVRSQVGEGLAPDLFQILQRDAVLPIRWNFYSLDLGL